MLGQKLIELRAVVKLINNRLPVMSPQFKKIRQVDDAFNIPSLAIKCLIVFVEMAE